MNQNKKKSSIPQNRIPIYTAAIASLAMLVVLMIVFVPKLISRMQAEDEPKVTLRNPEVTASEKEDPKMNSMLSELLLTNTDKTYTLSGTAQPEEAEPAESLYSIPKDAPLFLTAQNGITAEALGASLTVTKANSKTPVAIRLTEDNGGFLIAPAEGSWQEDTLYQVTVRGEGEAIPDFSSAFQTAHPFGIKTVYPGNERFEVPVTTGIEITFSDTVKQADFASYITVTPAIAGRFELYPNGKTVVIVPDKPLDTGTQYAVQIKAGLTADNGQSLNTAALYTFCTESEQSDAAPSMSFQIDSDPVVNPGSVGNIPFSLYFSNFYHSYNGGYEDPVFTVRVYAYPGADAAVAALRSGFSARKSALVADTFTPASTEGLSLVWEGTPEVYFETLSHHVKGYLYLPPLDAGTYLVDITASTKTVDSYTLTAEAQTFCQATPLHAYTEGTRGETLIWVNRTDNDPSAAQGVEITATLFENTFWMTADEAASGDPTKAFRTVTALTDEHGLASFPTTETNAALLFLRHVDQTLLLCIGTEETSTFRDYRFYSYADRAVYFPDDTVRFFGFLGATYEGQRLPETLYLCVGGSSSVTPVAVAPDGTFSGSFAISDWMGTYLSYTLSEKDPESGEYYTHIYENVRVTQEEKPVYQMDVSFDRLFYTYEDTYAAVTVKTSFFDGTPAAGLKVAVSSNLDGGGEHTVTTDEEGVATYQYKLRLPYQSDYLSTNAVSLYVNANLIGYETVRLYDYATTHYFHSSGVFEAQRINGQYSEVTLHALDTSRLLTEADFSYLHHYNENTKGAPLTDSVHVTLYKTEYIKVPEGSYYDPITKKNIERYYWQDKETIEKSETMEIREGVLRLDHLDASSFNGHYRYEISWRDPIVGRTYVCSVYANKGRDEVSDPWSHAEQYYLVQSAEQALPGDHLTATLYYDQAPAAAGVSVLYTRYARLYDRVDTLSIARGSAPVYDFDYTEADTRFSSVMATVFDGESYIAVRPVYFTYDFEAANNAEITVSTDKDTYKPGEHAVISVSSPALAGGKVLISVVDEACFALGDIDTAPLTEYFRFHYRGTPMRSNRYSLHAMLTGTLSGISRYGNKFMMDEAVSVETAESEQPPATGSDAQNGADDTYVRKDFLDNAAFHVLTLDENGEGQTSVKVPDNITTWRISAIGVKGVGNAADDAVFSSDVRIGMTVGDVICTIPFFINVTLPDLFLCEDEIAFSARCAGTRRAADPTATVSYLAVLQNEKFEEIATANASAAANDTAWFSFEALPAGEYYVTVTGMLGDDADAVRLTFRTTQTAQLVDYTETIAISEIPALSPAAFPLTLTFRDNTDTLYYDTIRRLYYGDGSRTESVAARYAAMTLSETLFGQTRAWYYSGLTTDDLAAQLNEYGGFLPLNRYAEGDPILTAEVLYCVPDAINAQNKATLTSLYQALLADRNTDAVTVAASLMGLAAMGEPVLDQIYNAASYAADAPTDVKLYLAAAFAAAADLRAAEAALAPIFADLGREMNDGSYCISDASTEEAIRLTALGLLTASRLPDNTRAMGMAAYLHNHTSSLDLYTLELAAFATYYVPTAPEISLLSFDLAGSDTIHVEIPRGRAYTISLTRSDLESFRVVSADEGLAVQASYGAAPETALGAKADDETLHMQKTITPYDMANGIYKVTLTFDGTTDVDSMAFSLTDTIPSGARYVGRYGAYSSDNYCTVWLSHDGGQQLHGSVYIYAPYQKEPLTGRTPYTFHDEVSYLIRGAVKGEFTAEPALAISRDADTYVRSEGYRIAIRDGAWDVKIKE